MYDTENYKTIKQLKDKIIELKLTRSNDDLLKYLLGSFTNMVNVAKEGMVIEKMNEVRALASAEVGKKDDSANAKVMSDKDESRGVS